MKFYTEETQASLKLTEFIKFCNLHFVNSYNLGGSLCEYFYVEDFSLDNVNDYDIVIDSSKYKINYLKNQSEVSEWKYQGDLSYIGEKKGNQVVYKSKLTLGEYTYSVDWIFGYTIRLKQETVDVEYQDINTKLTSKNLRINILKNIATFKQDKNFQNKAKLRLNSYLSKTIL